MIFGAFESSDVAVADRPHFGNKCCFLLLITRNDMRLSFWAKKFFRKKLIFRKISRLSVVFFLGRRFKCPKHVYIDIWPILGRFQPNFGQKIFGVRNFERQKNRFVGQKFFLSKNVLKPKFRCKTHLQALKDSFPARFVIFGRFRPIYRHFIFFEKMRFWPFFDVADFGRKFGRKWPDT